MRDITLGETFYSFFTTRAFATGVPTQLAGTPVLSVLEENNATPITAGVSVSVDRASVTGLNQATIVATPGNGYEVGKTYALYVSTGTVGGTSVVGEVVEVFTIQAAAAFTRLGAPAGASVSADIAGVQSDTNDIQTRLPAALTGAGNIKADALAVSDKTGYSLGAGGIPVGAFAAGAITDAASAADFETAIRDALWAKALEGTLTAEQIVRILLSALAGVTASGGAVLKTPDGLTTRITATLNASNERTAMVLTP